MAVRSTGGPRRGDGAATRAQLLDAAGRVFAEKGVDRATGREIAERAGATSAAINYYFGGMEGLYAEVLVEAHRRFASLEDITAVAEADAPPAEKLRRLLVLAVAAVVGRQDELGWETRVLNREFLAPSPSLRALEDRELLPKKRLVERIVGEVLGRPPGDPLIERCCLSIIAPITMMLVCAPESRRQAFPGLIEDEAAAEALARHLHAFAMGGLAAVGAGAGDADTGSA